MKNKVRIFAILALTLIMCGAAHAQSASAEGEQQFAELGDLKLHGGGVIHDFRIGYRTLGNLNAERSNAILWPTWLGARSEDLLPFVGAANMVDTGKYFVILVDSIGNGASSSPSTSKTQPLMKFPEFSIHDMVESEHRLATEVLHLPHLHAVIGMSMGGMQAFAWAVLYPDFVDLVIPMAGSPQSTSYDKLLWTTEIEAIELDPAWNHGNPIGRFNRGLALAAEIESMNATSPDYRVSHTNSKGFEAFVGGIKKNAKGGAGTACNQIRQRQAIISFNLPAELGVSLEQLALRVKSKMLIFIPTQDHLVNPEPARRFAVAVGAPIITLDSPCGHLSFACISVGPIVAQFLADPSLVHTQTLHEEIVDQ
jgi:homoserine O-acetyltransferase/O-succinyltransferase